MQFIKFISFNVCDIPIVMLQRGYIILIAGAILIITGITLTAVYGIGLADLVLSENIILSDVSINSSASANRPCK